MNINISDAREILGMAVRIENEFGDQSKHESLLAFIRRLKEEFPALDPEFAWLYRELKLDLPPSPTSI